jgi:hypothetical protein
MSISSKHNNSEGLAAPTAHMHAGDASQEDLMCLIADLREVAGELHAAMVAMRGQLDPRPDLSKLHALADRWEHSVHPSDRINARVLREALAEIEAVAATPSRKEAPTP